MLVELAVTLEDLYNGTTKKMKVTKNVVCSACEGSGSISKKKHTCQNCGGSGVCVLMRQFGPGMITKQQIRCDKCSGEGEAIPFKDRCKSCNGAKVKEERKILPVDIDKGMTDGKKYQCVVKPTKHQECYLGTSSSSSKNNPTLYSSGRVSTYLCKKRYLSQTP